MPTTSPTGFAPELIELANIGRGSVQRELSRLERSELVIIERHGNQKHYRANPDSPIFPELCSIIDKTLGIQARLTAAIHPISEQISMALIYGSIAKRSESASSDIDLLVVADNLTLEDLYVHLATAECELGRQINPTLYTNSEFNKRRAKGNAFLNRVLAAPTQLIKGTLDVT